MTHGITLAQSPGGVSSNLTLWLKANTNIPANITYNASYNVSDWRSEVGTFQVSQSNSTRQPVFTYLPAAFANFNFNPSVKFSAASFTSLLNTATTPNLAGSNGTIFMVVNRYQPAGQGSVLTYYSVSTTRFQVKPSFRVQNGVSSIGYKFDLNNRPGTIVNYPEESAFILTSAGAGPASRARRNASDYGPPTGNSSTYFPAVSPGLYLGSNGGSAEYTNHALAEVVIFNTTLSAADEAKVESYLAVKYGITFDEIAGQLTNYVSSDGTIIWNKTANTGYNENITGIGRDDASGLLQKQSHSVNTKGLIYLFNTNTGGTFPVMNDSNTTTINTDRSFMIAGDNDGDTSLTVCMMNNRITRMARIWKVQQTGSLGTATIALNNGILPCVKNMLVSSDPAFPDNQTTVIPMINGVYKYAAATLSNGQYFTFASDSLQTPQLVNAQACPGNSVTLTIQNPQNCAVYQWYGSQVSSTPVATGTSVTINPFTADTTLYVSVLGQGNCLFDSRVPVTVSLINVPAPVSNGVSICPGNTATLQVNNPQAGTTYNWYDAPSGGTLLGTGTSYTTPVLNSSTTYYVQATIAAGCSSLRSAVTVTVYPAAAAPGVISPVSICTGTSATLQVQPVTPGFTYTWYNTASGGTALATGNSYTTPSLTASQTFYAEAVSNNGCISNTRTPVQVNIDPPPSPPSVISPVTICPGIPADLQVQNPLPGVTYKWYATPGGPVLTTGATYTTPPLNTAATYYVTAGNSTGCASSATPAVVNIWTQLTTPRVSVADSNLNSITYVWNAVPGATGYLVSVDGINYVVPSSGTTGTTHIVTGLNPSQTVTLYVIATQTPACRNSLSGTASGRTWTYMSDVYVPTAFTPNNDGRNDLLKVIGTTVKKLNFSIYNRWGELVFATTDIQRGWNGTYKGMPQPSGTFVFYLDAELIDGSRRVKKGSIMLIR